MTKRDRTYRWFCLALATAATLLAGADLLRRGGSLRIPWLSPSRELAEAGYHELLSGNPGKGIEHFVRAVKQDPASAYRWCDLAEAWIASGDPTRAERCVLRAVELGPYLPAVLMRTANHYFGTGRPTQALDYTNRILKLVPDYDATIFSSYERFGVATADVLAAGLPDRRSAQAYIHYLIAGGDTSTLLAAWHWSESRGYADDALVDRLAAYLMGVHEAGAAVRAWVAYAGRREPGYPEGNAVFNGSFEREPVGRVFDWDVQQKNGVRTSREATASAAGRYAMKVEFTGTSNLSYRHISQRAPVRTGMYALQARVRSNDLSTDQGVGLRVFDPEMPTRLDVTTERLTGTNAWRSINIPIQVPAGTRLVEIQVVRAQSLKFDNKVRGEFWVDDIRLSRRRTEAPERR